MAFVHKNSPLSQRGSAEAYSHGLEFGQKQQPSVSKPLGSRSRVRARTRFFVFCGGEITGSVFFKVTGEELGASQIKGLALSELRLQEMSRQNPEENH